MEAIASTLLLSYNKTCLYIRNAFFRVVKHVMDPCNANNHLRLVSKQLLAIAVKFHSFQRLVLPNCHFNKLNLCANHMLVLQRSDELLLSIFDHAHFELIFTDASFITTNLCN